MNVFVLICLVTGALGLSSPGNRIRRRRPVVAFKPAVGFLIESQSPGKGQVRWSKPRIVGGMEAKPNSHPHQVSLQILVDDNWYHNCGGSIVSRNKIVTAAHCIVGFRKEEMRVVAGEHNLLVKEGTEQVRKIISATPHRKYNRRTFDYDYAVLRVSPLFDYNKNVQPIELVSEEPLEGSVVNTGWGDTSGRGTMRAEILQQVTLPIVSRLDCRDMYLLTNTITNRMICAGAPGIGSCRGDSGGPLIKDGLLVGIVSWGLVPCAESQHPAVYSNVVAVRNWLDNQ